MSKEEHKALGGHKKDAPHLPEHMHGANMVPSISTDLMSGLDGQLKAPHYNYIEEMHASHLQKDEDQNWGMVPTAEGSLSVSAQTGQHYGGHHEGADTFSHLESGAMRCVRTLRDVFPCAAFGLNTQQAETDEHCRERCHIALTLPWNMGILLPVLLDRKRLAKARTRTARRYYQIREWERSRKNGPSFLIQVWCGRITTPPNTTSSLLLTTKRQRTGRVSPQCTRCHGSPLTANAKRTKTALGLHHGFRRQRKSPVHRRSSLRCTTQDIRPSR